MNAALIQKLGAVFSPEQAQLLVEVIEEAYAATRDFNELKAIVAELAAAQKRTEEWVEQLAAAQKRTEERLEELAAAQKATERALKNLARQVGGLSESLGGSLEVVPDILEHHWGLEIEFCDRDILGTGEYEFDLVIRGQIQGRQVLVLGEVKSNITASEVERFLALVAQVEAGAGVEVRPLFFGYRLDREARMLIQEAGAVMISTRGKYLA
ncbi:MAG: hypothetical protein Q6J78_01525 [Thermostichales cyanobacterium SRBZ-1_bins_19]